MPGPSNFSSFVPIGVATPENLNRNYAAFTPEGAAEFVNLRSDAASLAYKYANIDQVTLWGAELSGDVRIAEGVALVGSIAYVRGSNLAPLRYDEPTNTYVPLPFSEPLLGIYPLNSTIGIRFFEPRNSRWSFETTLRMVGRQNRVASSMAELPTAGFTVVGLQGFYQLNERVRFFSSIDNLFDRPYTQHGSLAIVNPGGAVDFVNEPGFSWIMGIEARF
jgi:outer membrane receptor protein involved in Fe transport